MNNSNDIKKLTELSEMPVGRLLWRYSLPAIVGMMVTALYNVVDRIFIGQGVGPEAIAGLAITFPVMNLSAALGVLIGAGGSARISILLGSKDNEGASRTLGNALVTLVCIIVFYLSIFAIFVDEILMAFGASEVTLPYARDFMLYILPGMLMTNFAFTFNNFMRVSGYPVKAMITMFIGAGLNAILAPLFIFVLHLGIKGAAIATDISMCVSAIFVMAHFFNPRSNIRFLRQRLMYKPSLKIILPIIAIGAAPSLVNAAACFINVIINKSLSFYGGDIAVGAAGIFTSYTSLMTMVVVGLCQGMQPILGYNYGAGQFHRLKRTYWLAVAAASAIVVTGQVVGMAIPGYIARAFTTDQHLIDETVRCLNISMTCFCVVGFQIISTTLFQSLGKAGASVFLSLTRQVLFLIPLLLILPKQYGLDGIWASFPISDLLATCVTVIMIVVMMRKLRVMSEMSVRLQPE
ncbi:MAG: MATE family efflux transporter [Muribaculaceae bacterium]|nr:MATE family efflux transporter [Muribaculaceae bacterium]